MHAPGMIYDHPCNTLNHRANTRVPLNACGGASSKMMPACNKLHAQVGWSVCTKHVSKIHAPARSMISLQYKHGKRISSSTSWSRVSRIHDRASVVEPKNKETTTPISEKAVGTGQTKTTVRTSLKYGRGAGIAACLSIEDRLRHASLDACK